MSVLLCCLESILCYTSALFLRINNPEIMSTLSKSVKQCVLRMTEDKISFVAIESGVLGGVHLWCELSQVS